MARVATKVAVSIVAQEGASPMTPQRWRTQEIDIRRDPTIAGAIVAFLETHRPRSVAMTEGIIGCPHEEGIDYPLGGVCPGCPFWADRDRWKDA